MIGSIVHINISNGSRWIGSVVGNDNADLFFYKPYTAGTSWMNIHIPSVIMEFNPKFVKMCDA